MRQNYGRIPNMRRPQFGNYWPYNGYHNYQSYLHQQHQVNYQPYPFQTNPNQSLMYHHNIPTYSYPNPYPKANQSSQQPTGVQSLISQFKNKDGTYDINKLMDTAGQMMGAYNQVSSIVKGLTKTFKV